MRKCEYIEGNSAVKNFEEGMKALFKVSKDEVVKAERKAKRKRASRGQHKPRTSDRD
jgi:hypothetical protein